MNIRYELDPIRVADAVARNVADLERQKAQCVADEAALVAEYQQAVADGTAHRWTRKPELGRVGPIFDDAIALEKTRYATVRVIELPQPGKRFILVYGDAEDATCTSGTGPFESIEKAGDWFFNLGR